MRNHLLSVCTDKNSKNLNKRGVQARYVLIRPIHLNGNLLNCGGVLSHRNHIDEQYQAERCQLGQDVDFGGNLYTPRLFISD